MKLSPLQSLFFFSVIILQASWCLASENTSGESLAKLPQSQAEEATINDVEVGVPRCTELSSFWGQKRIKCMQPNSEKKLVDIPNVKYPRKLENVVGMQTMSFSHKGGAGGGGGGVGGTRGGGAESAHHTHKKHNNAISLASCWTYILLEIGVYAIATLSFTLN